MVKPCVYVVYWVPRYVWVPTVYVVCRSFRVCVEVTPCVYVVCWVSRVCRGHTMCACTVLGFLHACGGHTVSACGALTFLSVWWSYHACTVLVFLCLL